MQSHSYNNLLVLQQSLDQSTGVPTTCSSSYSPKPNLHSSEKTASYCIQIKLSANNHLDLIQNEYTSSPPRPQAEYWDKRNIRSGVLKVTLL